MELDNPNSIHAVDWFLEESHVERLQRHFKQTYLTREELYTIGILALLDDDDDDDDDDA